MRELDRRGVDTLVDGAHAPGMLPVDLDALGAAYWTGNGHKWLCAPKGSGVLHVRADLRAAIRPLVVSHGANDAAHGPVPLPPGVRLDRHGRPHALPRDAGGDPVRGRAPRGRLVRAHGRERGAGPGGPRPAVRRARRPAPAPDAMLGSMAAVPLPDVAPTAAAAERLQAALFDEDRIEVPVLDVPGPRPRRRPGEGPAQALVRISAQRYNRPEEYAWLAERLAARVRGARSPRSLLGRLRRG